MDGADVRRVPQVIGESMARGVARAEADVASLLDLLATHGPDPDSALDVACGIGRHAVELARAGLEVDGVDISPEYVATARDRAADAGVGSETSFEVLDVRDLGTLDTTADLVLHWFGFGYFEDEVNEEVAATLRDCTAPGGATVSASTTSSRRSVTSRRPSPVRTARFSR